MTRAKDEEILGLLHLRCAGLSTVEISALTGISDAVIRAATNKIRDADAAESGEDVSRVYWPGKSGPVRR